MNRFIVPLGVFAVLAALLLYGVKHAPDKEFIPSPLIGKPAPEVSLPTLADPDRKVTTSMLRGRWYAVNVWATWCEGCRQEHPMLLEARKSGRIPIIGLDWKDDDERARAWLSRLGNPYEVVLVDHDGRTVIDWGVYLAPETFLVNDRGIIVYKQAGPLTREVWAKEFLGRLDGAAEAAR